VPARAQQRVELIDDALLAADGAVAVVEQQDPRRPAPCAARRDGRRGYVRRSHWLAILPG
jgi:hypothetical protein